MYNYNFTIVSHNCDIDHITQKNVEKYLIQRWGNDKVCHIGSFGKFGTKTVIKDLCRVYELDFNLSNRLTSLFNTTKTENDIESELKNARIIAEKTNDLDLIKFIDSNKRLFVNIGGKMLGMVRQQSRHASGILISNNSFDKTDLPISYMKGDLVTGVQEGGDEREVSELGFLKLDILGLNTATIINETIKLIEKKYNLKNIENKILLSDFDDELVYKEFEKGNTKDIFQFGSDSMIGLIKKIKPKSILDLCAINALFRPALISSGSIEEFIKNREKPQKAKKEYDKISPKIWPLLEETFGIPLYQESIMFILQNIGGFTMAEADKARKTLKLLHKGNQDKSEDFIKMINKFKEQAIKNGLTDEGVNKLLEKLAAYTEYSFNKSHSLAYAMNAYISQWLKVYYTKEYFATLLNYSNIEEIPEFIQKANQMGIKINSCTYYKSTEYFDINYKENSINFGLNLIKSVRKNDINILTQNKVKTKLDLIKLIINKKINKKTIEILSRVGYFRDIISDNYYFTEKLIFKLKESSKDIDLNYKKLIKYEKDFYDYTLNEKRLFQKEYMGFYLDNHPFSDFYEKLLQKQIASKYVRPKDIVKNTKNNNIELIGVLTDIKFLKSKKSNNEYIKLFIEDDEESVIVTLFDIESIVSIKKGDFIKITCNNSGFGLTKTRDSIIKVFKNDDNLNQDKLKEFPEININIKKKSLF